MTRYLKCLGPYLLIAVGATFLLASLIVGALEINAYFIAMYVAAAQDSTIFACLSLGAIFGSLYFFLREVTPGVDRAP